MEKIKQWFKGFIWKKEYTLYSIILILVIIIIVLLSQRKGSLKPIITDTTYQDSLIRENLFLNEQLKDSIKIYNSRLQLQEKLAKDLIKSYKEKEEQIKKDKQLIYEKINTIPNYSNEQLAREYSNF